jgi:hypothetical protein
MDSYDPEVAERTLAFAVKVSELALLLAGEFDENVALLLDDVRKTLGDALTGVERDLFIVAIRRRKDQIERSGAIPARCQ